MEEKYNTKVLEALIVGKVKPKIYGFTTNTVPNYMKVGDTYRPIHKRIEEWKRVYPNLVKQFESDAQVNEDIYFRDYSVHKYLEKDLNKKRLRSDDVKKLKHFSNEFFKSVNNSHLEKAITDIKDSYFDENRKMYYRYYSIESQSNLEKTYSRGEDWELRPNQRKVVENFKNAIEAGRSNLLMYAVMRFGKTFTSLYCTKEIQAKKILIVSAKADVKEEWKKTTQSAGNFENYVFLTSDDLNLGNNIIENVNDSNKVAVVFLTLQDLSGKNIKQRHEEIFETMFDVLIIDETHFGARAEEYGRVLADDSKYLNSINDDMVDTEVGTNLVKVIKTKIKIHLSGTPYRILMGSEFSSEDIISFIQFTDIVNEQNEWDQNNLNTDGVNEWDNPYYGVPQMIRFALLPNESSLQKIQVLEKNGVSFALSSLFQPKSIKVDPKNNYHKKFQNEREILDLLHVIDGSKDDDNLFGFLDYEKFKQGNMLNHIVMVLPYCASCDAMEALIQKNIGTFINLSDYEIINISGFDGKKNYQSPVEIKNKISSINNEGRKSLTLTVNRMLTGSTVEEWDTMLYFKDSSSPQEYDQATFRLQNQHVRELKSGTSVIKENLKPQTVLIDFDPNRMFRMQEQKSKIYNANMLDSGNSYLKERIEEEIRISPIITLNKNKFSQVSATNILNVISEYNKNKSVLEEVIEIPVDFSILNNIEIYKEILKQPEFGSKKGLVFEPYEGDVVDIVDLESVDGSQPGTKEKSLFEYKDDKDKKKLENKIRTYYQRILFYSFLTRSNVNSLGEIIDSISSVDNLEICYNLGLDLDTLVSINRSMNSFKLSDLDYKIQNINMLSNDTSMEPLERAKVSISKFNRMSESEILTPSFISKTIVSKIPDSKLEDIVTNGKIFLDFGSKSAEFSLAIYERLSKELNFNHDEISRLIYAIPTSSIAYEFTRKFYDILKINTDQIIKSYNAYDLIKNEKEISINNLFTSKGVKSMKFGAIVGNPPYNIADGGAGASSRPIYHEFIEQAKSLNPDFISFIIPTRWFAGGKGLDNFRENMINDKSLKEIHDFLNPEVIFPGTSNRGGVCYFIMDKDYNDIKTRFVTYKDLDVQSDTVRTLKTSGSDIIIRDSVAVSVIHKVFNKDLQKFTSIVSPRKPYGLASNIIKSNIFKETKSGMNDPVSCLGKGQRWGYVEREIILNNTSWIDEWKLFTPRANNIGTELPDDNFNTIIGTPNSICTEAYLSIGQGFINDKQEAVNLQNYVKTKFFRFMHKQGKASHDASRRTFNFVPVLDFSENSDIDWSKSIENIDSQLFSYFDLNHTEIAHILNDIT